MDSRYSAKSGYENIVCWKNQSQVQVLNWPKFVWIKGSPRKIRAFIWKMIQDRIPTLVNLKKRKLIHEEVKAFCKMCNQDEEESVEHLFFHCSFPSAVWKKIGKWLDLFTLQMVSPKDHLLLFANLCGRKGHQFFSMVWQGVMWFIG